MKKHQELARKGQAKRYRPYKRRPGTTDYHLRNVPADLLDRVKEATEQQNTTIRRVLLTALIQFDMQVTRDRAHVCIIEVPDGSETPPC